MAGRCEFPGPAQTLSPSSWQSWACVLHVSSQGRPDMHPLCPAVGPAEGSSLTPTSLPSTPRRAAHGKHMGFGPLLCCATCTGRLPSLSPYCEVVSKFPITAIANYHQLSGSKQRKCIFLQCVRSPAWDSLGLTQVSAGLVLPRGSGGELVSLPFPASRGRHVPWLMALAPSLKPAECHLSDLRPSSRRFP